MTWEIRQGDALDRLREMPDESGQCCVTSPPYFGLRDYGVEGAIGLEPTPSGYVEKLVSVFREVRRVLRGDGTLWLNLGDSYAGSWGAQSRRETPAGISGNQINNHPKRGSHTGTIRQAGLKPKDLIGIPWRVAFALQADGWWLRSDIVWAKPNPMPESVTDRPTRAHEFLFLLAKSERYFYDRLAILEPWGDDRRGRDYARPGGPKTHAEGARPQRERNRGGRRDGFTKPNAIDPSKHGGANKRSVWSVATKPYKEAHFATFPPELIEPCILAGSKSVGHPPAASPSQRRNVPFESGAARPESTVLDPFAGAGTTGVVALRHDRSFIGVELSPQYVEMARRRIVDDAPLMNAISEVPPPAQPEAA